LEPLLAARDVTVIRGGSRIVDAASIALAPRAAAAIEGASGSGRSTFLRALATLIPVASGTISFEGREPEAVGLAEYRRRVAYVPQAPRMFEGSVADNVRAGPRFRGTALTDDDVLALLERAGLEPGFAPRAAGELSGGERLRVALARALANDPRVLLLDEPTSALDPDIARRIVDSVAALSRAGTAVLMVTHSEEHAARLGGARWRMTNGALREDREARAT
jgi:ABC-type iron transport system FetAB ATPase subunit